MNKITKEEFLNRATAKNIKQMRGHDGPSQEWDIYFDNKKICNCWDDSWGGELQISNYENKNIETIYNTIDKESLYDKNWKWTTSLPLLLEEIKTNVRFSKDEKKGICLGFDKSNYNINGFKTDIKTSLSRWNDSKDDYEKIIIQECKGDIKVLNFEYLISMGINVPQKFQWNESKYVKSITN
jgi:hypothetical protein